ncbi:hypothetical protein ABE137_06810 [Brevibacillus laterosporus]|uniref:hypothetical protein n=1 Tax=Brevibacillus laterosporus TaxID=1465 RepID=UPI003D1A2560
MFKEIDPCKIEVGKRFLYEEKSHFAAEVTILEDKSKEDWVGYKLRVDNVIFGMNEIKIGDEFNCGYDKVYGQAYKYWKFKKLGSMTDYVINRTAMGVFGLDKERDLDINNEDITVISEKTRESGNVIGNMLKTVLPRLNSDKDKLK